MNAIEVTLENRVETGTSSNSRMRKEGFIPAIVYSRGKNSKSVKVPLLEYRKSISGKGPTQLFVLKSIDKDINGLLALVKDVHIEPLRDDVMHIDFYSFTDKQKIRVSVPVLLTGECAAVKLGNSILNHLLHEVEVECLPTAIPTSLSLDITNLVEGHSLHVRDIELPANVVLKTSGDASVVSVVHYKEEVVAPVAVAQPVVEGEVVEGAAPTTATEGAAAEKQPAEKKASAEKK